MDGKRPPQGPVVVFDDDHYYLGCVVAEVLAREGHQVKLVTPELSVERWKVYTLEQSNIEKSPHCTQSRFKLYGRA